MGEAGDRGAGKRDAQQARLARALRDNLRRRKEQRRAQQADAGAPPSGKARGREPNSRS
jgi:hypothetical protein